MMRRALLFLLALGCIPAPALARKAKPKFYVELSGVKEPAKSPCKLKAKTRELVLAELRKQPKIVTKISDRKLSAAELKAELKRRRLAGYAIIVRITTCKHKLLPPRKGKVYKVLMVEVSTAIDAEKIPSGQMALAGEGSAQVGTEVARIKQKELQTLRIEALTESLKQAVSKFVKTLGKKPRRGKRRRRRR